MKQNIPTPYVVGAIVLALAVMAFFLMRGAIGEQRTPRPDPSRFMKTTPAPGS